MVNVRAYFALGAIFVVPVLAVVALFAACTGLGLLFGIPHPGLAAAAALVPTAGAVGLVVWVVRAAAANLADAPAGLRVTSQSQPVLWGQVQQAARSTNSVTPDELRISATAISQYSVHSGRRVLTIGYPSIIGLTSVQWRALLTYELARHHREQLTTAQKCLTIVGYLSNVAELCDERFRSLATAYANYARQVADPVVVDVDRYAISQAAKLAGTKATRTMLHRVALIEQTWAEFADTHIKKLRQEQKRAPLHSGFRDFFAAESAHYEAAARQRLTEPVVDGPVVRLSLAARIAFVPTTDAHAEAGQPATAAAPAYTECGDDAHWEAFESHVTNSAWPHVTWQEIYHSDDDIAVHDRASAVAAVLLKHHSGFRDRSAVTYGEAISAFGGATLDTPGKAAYHDLFEVTEEEAHNALRDVVVSLLVREQVLRYEYSFAAGNHPVIVSSGAPFELALLAKTDGFNAQTAYDVLETLRRSAAGVRLGLVLEPTPEPAPAQAPAETTPAPAETTPAPAPTAATQPAAPVPDTIDHAAADTGDHQVTEQSPAPEHYVISAMGTVRREDGRHVDVFIWQDGVMMVPCPPAALVAQQTPDQAADHMNRLAQTAQLAWHEQARIADAQWFDFNDVVHGTLQQTPHLSLNVALFNGAQVSLETTMSSLAIEDPAEKFQYFLANKLTGQIAS